ncbi:hypothetical protein [Rubritalea tangerina]
MPQGVGIIFEILDSLMFKASTFLQTEASLLLFVEEEDLFCMPPA